MHKYAIIVAGGKGERMGTEIPKQFLELAGKPIIMHSLEKFKTTFPTIEIILALPENQIDFWKELCCKHKFTTIPHQLVKGGETRFHSVKNALELVKQKSIIAIHDGVRPLVSTKTITTCFNEAEKKGNAIPVVPVVESLRYVNNEQNEAVKRSCYRLAQTPQCFSSEIILKAYQQQFDVNFTDDASVAEKLGEMIHLVEGNTENIKITTATDLIIAEALLK
ncbi:MAG: 2-C-methyl-D-erythritol 4-phosphate cytidylyltransferase [Flavobacteriales bacterium CG_4_9_14_3_um_filter_32_8]|nr:MAG: 2-C-methyl-D-erythritol 4-phosphate cytidylyltransferase [Flavobacteriales bacterium CG_4_9_14_3_um_filter_32_8]